MFTKKMEPHNNWSSMHIAYRQQVNETYKNKSPVCQPYIISCLKMDWHANWINMHTAVNKTHNKKDLFASPILSAAPCFITRRAFN